MIRSRIVKALLTAAFLTEKSPKDVRTLGFGFECDRRYFPFIRDNGEENTCVCEEEENGIGTGYEW